MTAVHYPPQIRRLWLYRRTAPAAWQVGFFDPVGDWHADSVHTSPDAAAERAHWLNGGPPTPPPAPATAAEVADLQARLHDMDRTARKWRSLAIRRARKARERRRARR